MEHRDSRFAQFALSYMLITIHYFCYFPYIYVYRTVPHTAATAGALNTIIVFVHIVLELVHESLAHTLHLLIPGIMT